MQAHFDISPALVFGQPPSLNKVLAAHGIYNEHVISLCSYCHGIDMRLTVQSGIMPNSSLAVVFGDICATTITTKKDPSSRRRSGDMMATYRSECLGDYKIRRMVRREKGTQVGGTEGLTQRWLSIIYASTPHFRSIT